MKLSYAWRFGALLFVVFLFCGAGFAQCRSSISVSPQGTFPFGPGGGSNHFTVTPGGNGIVTCQWDATHSSFISVSPSFGGGDFKPPFSTDVNFNVAANPNLAPRTGFITVTQREDQSSATEFIQQDASGGDFSIIVNPTSQSVIRGSSTSYNVFINRTGGFNGFVQLSCPGLPSGVTCGFSNNGTLLTVNTTASAPLGNFGVTVMGVNGNVNHSTSVTLNIRDDFSLSIVPNFETIVPGGSASYTVLINRLGGFADPVLLSTPDLPGISFSFNPNETTGNFSTLTATSTGAISIGQSNVAVTGVGADMTRFTQATLNVIPTPSALRFVPVTPCRVADTRNPPGPFGGPFLSAGTSRGFTIPNSACNIPATAQSYSLNVTVVPHGLLGYLTMFPCGQTQPFVSTLNSIDGRVKAVAAIVPADASGSVCAFASHDTDMILDINGYFVPATDPSALAFYPVTPCRLVDTRGATAPLGGPSLVGNAVRTFPILSSSCNVPSTAQAYSLNFTSVPQGSLGFLTTWPAGQAQPLVSTLNAPTGAITANAAIVPAGTNGDVSVFVTNNSDLVIDINGYFAPPGPGGLSLYNLSPCRVYDSRTPPGIPPLNGMFNIDVGASVCGVPTAAQSYVLNATVVPPGPLGYLTLWAQGAAQPLVSTLNASDGVVTSNMTIVPTNNGSIGAFTSNPTHLVLDISGYLAP